MFIGSTYELAEAQEEKTMFGWGRIKVMARVLSSTRTQIRDDVHITSSRAQQRILNCEQARDRAHDPDIKIIWASKAQQLRLQQGDISWDC